MVDYTQLYCPSCAGRLDAHGACWPKCEYEAWVGPPPPLTREQALTKRIENIKSSIRIYRKEIRTKQSTVERYQQELNQLKGDNHE
ncbi:hypothetical protein HMF8227_02328 [Saliniradius amylolyticus]|uniref:Uncharacterized protein n=1 Tax=Saliniradius amylolyticus TaxID=2183582 RepID=A0A2S2E6B0_9ALTE|nr:hypothetical protein [Saliniradius amylolyticus]AWL12780.1 hypothetical protein HMF8227_02328 [Saliniradius amylolyticus]